MNSLHYHVRPKVLRAIRGGRWNSEFKTSRTSRSFLEEVICYLGFADQPGSLVHGAGETGLLEGQCDHVSSSHSAPPTNRDQICWQSVPRWEPLQDKCGGEGPLRAWAQISLKANGRN